MISQLDTNVLPTGKPGLESSSRTLRGIVHFENGDSPKVFLKGPNPATGWMDYLHLPLGYLARVMFTMPHDDYYGSHYFLEALQEATSRVHLESLTLELSVGMGMKHPEWFHKELKFGIRQRMHANSQFYKVEATLPEQFPGGQLAQAFALLALEVHQMLPATQGELLLEGLRRMAIAYASGEVNPYDWHTLFTFSHAVMEDLLSGVALRSSAMA